MSLVLDASAALEVVLQRPWAGQIAKSLSENDEVLAPTLYIAEVTNAFCKYYRAEELSREQCEIALERAKALPDSLISESDLYREAFAMACLTNMSAHDMFYLVLARRNNAALLTLDGKLQRVARQHDVRVLSLGEEASHG